MKWLKLFLIIFLLYYGTRQPAYLSSAKYQDPNLNEIKRVQAFLHSYNSPLQNNAVDFVHASVKYKIDPKVLVAISGVESGFGKNTPNCAVYNSFGFSNPGANCRWYNFSSYRESIWTVAQTLGTSRTYLRFQQTGSINELSCPYNNCSQDWAGKVRFFSKLI